MGETNSKGQNGHKQGRKTNKSFGIDYDLNSDNETNCHG